MSNYPQKFQLKILSQSENLEIIREFVAKIAAKAGFDENNVNKIELAVDEACANVIKHAYTTQDTFQIMNVSIEINLDNITIIVSDQGKGFDIEKIKPLDINKYIAEMRVGGLGIYLMRNLMDKVEFNINRGQRNEVKMIKYLTNQNGQLVSTSTSTLIET